jgi:hypothetical protein
VGNEGEEQELKRITASKKPRQRKIPNNMKQQSEVNEMLKEIESAAGRTLYSHRYPGNREKKKDPAPLQYIASSKGEYMWKDVVPKEKTDQCCKME